MEETPDISHTSRSHRPADGNGLTTGEIRVTSSALVCTRMRELYRINKESLIFVPLLALKMKKDFVANRRLGWSNQERHGNSEAFFAQERIKGRVRTTGRRVDGDQKKKD
ncbi:hypothetical protein ZIOFF_074287 (mitochondrion) [Zingiber officinale]|uniref:Uncharacterized protein n=1 Tax=Zingiber officinale TaxID=94328 RepID=A0A8J5C617_ZINOF|nr:hypothetical protein ZIOFF_074803 [Zingiber officinale]KAG6467780.1 hypothetical protein ZIOFF_074287 [Zingiber officinale]